MNSAPVVFLARDANLTLECSFCHWVVCSETCLARHRDRYTCHNTGCVYHHPPPHLAPAGESASSSNVGAASNTAAATADPDGNLVFRETITREYRMVNGQLVQIPDPITTSSGDGTVLPPHVTSEEIAAQARLVAEYERIRQESANQPRSAGSSPTPAPQTTGTGADAQQEQPSGRDQGGESVPRGRPSTPS